MKERVKAQAFQIIKISDNDNGEVDLLEGVEFTIKAKKDIDQYGSWEKAPVAKNAKGKEASVLVTDEKELTPKTIKTIKEASEKGVKIMISSGRSFYRLEKYIEALDLKKEGQYTICFNGGMIVENATGNIIFSKNL